MMDDIRKWFKADMTETNIFMTVFHCTALILTIIDMNNRYSVHAHNFIKLVQVHLQNHLRYHILHHERDRYQNKPINVHYV